MPGPLAGFRVIEFAGLGPGPFCATMLSDMGAEVIRIDRPAALAAGGEQANWSVHARGRASVVLDLKVPEARAAAMRLIKQADALIEGFRPGVMEKLGLGPDACLTENGKLVYGRMTGWGQEGPLASRAGHDINYIALAGALWPMGEKDRRPAPPLNVVGDFGGGGMFLAFGIVCALLEATRSGRGQVVDAAMVDGAAALIGFLYGLRAAGRWTDGRGENMLDGGAPWYGTYETADGKFVAVGAIEPQFYAELLERLGLSPDELPRQNDRAGWPQLRERFEAVFRTRTRDDWTAVFEGSDACFAPVLTPWEAPTHPHNAGRHVFADVGGLVQPAPAPRFSRTAATLPAAPHAAGADTEAVLRDWGFGATEISDLLRAGAALRAPAPATPGPTG